MYQEVWVGCQGKSLHQKGGQAQEHCPGQCLSPIPGGFLKAMEMWHLGTGFAAGGEAGVDDLKGFFNLFCHWSSSPLNLCCSKHELLLNLESAWIYFMGATVPCLGTAFRAVLKLYLNRKEKSIVFEDKPCCQPWARDSSDAGPVLGALGKKSLLGCCQCLDLWLGAVKHVLFHILFNIRHCLLHALFLLIIFHFLISFAYLFFFI